MLDDGVSSAKLRGMTWELIGNLMVAEMGEALAPLPAGFWGSHSDWIARTRMLYEANRQHAERIDASMREFAATQIAPRLDPGILNYLQHARLSAGIMVLDNLLTAQRDLGLVQNPGEARLREILTWICIDTWHGGTWDWWLKLFALRSLSGKDSLFGL